MTEAAARIEDRVSLHSIARCENKPGGDPRTKQRLHACAAMAGGGQVLRAMRFTAEGFEG